MGCWCSKNSDKNKMEGEQTKKVYSWDRKEDIDPSQYMLDGLQKGLVVKSEGSIDGQQFIVQNCQNSTIFILDYSDTITVDNCSECKIVIGPVQGSIFFRNCDGCSCAVSCQQFRTRDCDDFNIYLLCTTQPVIEASRNMRFYPLQLTYKNMLNHYSRANLSMFNNHWDNVHDFTPGDSEKNWKITPNDLCPTEVFSLTSSGDGEDVESSNKSLETLKQLSLSFVRCKSDIPVARGGRARTGSSCVVMFFHHRYYMGPETVLEVLRLLCGKLNLVKTRQVQLSSEEATRIFIDDSEDALVCRKASERGMVVGAELSGEDAIIQCQEITKKYLADMTSANQERLIYCAPNEEDTSHVLGIYNSICDNRFTF